MITYLAPMEGVTDHIFRQVVSKASAPDFFVTEFTNADGWNVVGEKAISKRLFLTQKEIDNKNIIAQIWGKDPKAFEKISYHCAENGFVGIDINTGCPDKTVIKNGCGSALINNNTLVEKLIKSCKKSNLPVSVKTRLGLLQPEIDTWIRFLLEQNLDTLSIHLRTRKEMSKVKAHFELIPTILDLRDKLNSSTKIVINGDITSIQHGIELQKQFGNFDGIMIGRGIFHNIFIFSKNNTLHTLQDKLDLFLYHIELLEKENISSTSYNIFKKFFKVYINNYRGANEDRIKMMETTDFSELKNVIKKTLIISELI